MDIGEENPAIVIEPVEVPGVKSIPAPAPDLEPVVVPDRDPELVPA